VASPTARAKPGNGIPAKRKADDEARASEQKQPRLASNANGSARSNVDASKAPRPAERSSSGYTGSARPSTAAATNNKQPRPLTEKPASAASKKPSSTTSGKPSPTTPTFPTASRTATSTNSPLSRPVPVSKPAVNDAGAGATAKAPKKGSYAEIKARAAAQAQKLQTIGKIQHRAVEKQPTKKEQEAEDAKLGKKGVKPGSKPVAGLSSKDGGHSNGNGLPDRGLRGSVQKGTAGKAGNRVAATIEERKPKKAALATTGYSGSARPPPSKAKPGAARSGNGRDHARPPNPLGMFSRPRRKDDEYDEDMDDFIDDDEDEPEDEGYGRRYRYADEDDDSDMEAGYSDVEDEEEAAARLARLEDQREEAILEQRRREKEARKRAAGR
jgi:protein SPT2